jgi:hypothetical protein
MSRGFEPGHRRGGPGRSRGRRRRLSCFKRGESLLWCASVRPNQEPTNLCFLTAEGVLCMKVPRSFFQVRSGTSISAVSRQAPTIVYEVIASPHGAQQHARSPEASNAAQRGKVSPPGSRTLVIDLGLMCSACMPSSLCHERRTSAPSVACLQIWSARRYRPAALSRSVRTRGFLGAWRTLPPAAPLQFSRSRGRCCGVPQHSPDFGSSRPRSAYALPVRARDAVRRRQRPYRGSGRSRR